MEKFRSAVCGGGLTAQCGDDDTELLSIVVKYAKNLCTK